MNSQMIKEVMAFFECFTTIRVVALKDSQPSLSDWIPIEIDLI